MYSWAKTDQGLGSVSVPVAVFWHKTREDWKKLVILYDNMCHINNLKVA